MKHILLLAAIVLLSSSIFSQSIIKPLGCYAGSNNTNPAVLAHPEARGVLIAEHWSNIETSPGVFDFSSINDKIELVTNANLKYSLAILGGTLGSPDWVVDSIGATYFNTIFQDQAGRLPLWWDSLVLQRLEILITELGNQYSQDSSLSHVYVTQMTTNGIEGHLNGVDMSSFALSGYTDQKWISSAKLTTYMFAQAFPNIPIIFEVHEIDQNTNVPATIINDLFNDTDLCERVGLAMWWISGKTTYQPDLIDFIANFNGDKYAQVIGRSDQIGRFKDSLYSTVFLQAKELGIRYIEPWPYEFQHHTNDSLLQDFNLWADTTFSAIDMCSTLTAATKNTSVKSSVLVYPNPTNEQVNLKISLPYDSLTISIYSMIGQKLITTNNQVKINISSLRNGAYLLIYNVDGVVGTKRIIKVK